MDLLTQPQSANAPENRRRCGRLGQELLRSSLGPVTDLSGTGMRVITNRIPKKPRYVHLKGLGTTVKVLALPCWVRRVGMRKLEVGLRFVDLDEETRRQLTAIAATNRVRRTL